MTHRILGLDIGASHLAASVIEVSLRSRRLIFHGQLVLERPDNAAGERPTGLPDAELIKRFLAEIDCGFDEVALALPAEAISWRGLDLPFSKRSKIEQVVPFEIESSLPFDIEELLLEIQPMQSTAEKTRVAVSIVRRETLAGWLERLDSAGLDPRVVTSPHWALHRAAAFGLQDVQGPALVMEIGATATLLLVYDSGSLLTARTIGRGGDQLSEHLARRLTCSFAEAERGKVNEVDIGPAAGGETGARLRELALEGLEPWLIELRQTLLATLGERDLERVLLSGRAGLQRGFAEWLASELEAPVRLLDPCAVLPERDVEIDEQERAGATLSIGLALIGTGTARAEVNFRKGSFSYARASHQLGGRFKPLVAMAAVLLVLLVVNLYMGYASTRGKAQEVQQQIDAVWRRVFPGEAVPANVRAEMEKRMQLDRDKLKLIGELGDGSIMLVELLHRMSERTPARDLTVDFTKLEATPDALRIEGEVGRFEDVDRLESALQELPGVVSIKKENVDRSSDGKIKFKLILSLVVK